MSDPSKIRLCYPCGFFRPGDAEDPIAGEYQRIGGAIWPKTARLFWDKLKAVPAETVAGFSGGTLAGNGSIQVPFLNETWRVDPREESVTRVDETKGNADDEWDSQIPFLVLVYLANVRKDPAAYDMVVPRDLFKGVDIFRNGLQLEMNQVEETFGNDREGFLRIAERLGGEPVRGGDAAVRFHLFPKFPADYILWLGDSEFPASLTLLVDRGTPHHLTADAIGVALNLLSRRLCRDAVPGSLSK